MSINSTSALSFSTLALVLASSLGPVGAARAQRWVVVHSGIGEPTEADRAARVQLIDALRGTGIEFLVDADAAARVEGYSVEPLAVEFDRIEELRAAVTALEEHAALRHREGALREAERIRELSEGLTLQFAEQSEVAERLFAACVAEAWLHIQLREREEARTGLRQCRELHPDAEIDPVTVAPPVVDMLRDIDAELSRRPTSSLTLSGVPAGCELRMDGRRRATAPDPIPNIVPGEHRIEVVCDGMRRRRIHRVIVGPESQTLPFDVRFDDVLRTRPSALGQSPEVRLDYASDDDEGEHRIDDALVIAGLLEASDIVLVSRDSHGLRFDRVSAGSNRIAATVVVEAFDFVGAEVVRAATALVDTTTARSEHAATSEPNPPSSVESSSRRASDAGIALLLAGGVLAGAGSILLGVGAPDTGALNMPRMFETYPAAQARQDQGTALVASGIAGIGVGAVTIVVGAILLGTGAASPSNQAHVGPNGLEITF